MSDIPVFVISPIGIVSGVLIGVVTVFLAAQAPAKRAARVSPVAAVSGNAADAKQVKRAAVGLDGCRGNVYLCGLRVCRGFSSWDSAEQIYVRFSDYRAFFLRVVERSGGADDIDCVVCLGIECRCGVRSRETALRDGDYRDD